MQLSFANIFQLDAIGKVSGAFCSQDFQLTNGSLQLRCGKLADFPVESHAALRIGVTDGTAEHATLSDITFPYAHLGCPITLKPKTVTGLWQWGSHAAATAELL